MAANRLDRELETREKTARKKRGRRPTVLPDPTPEDGYTLSTGFAYALMVNLMPLMFPQRYVKAGNLYVQKITPRYLLTPCLTRVSRIMSSLAV